MGKFQKVKKPSFTRAEVQAVVSRLSMFIEINSHYEQTEMVLGNSIGMSVAKTLLTQLLNRGEMWTGGYLDNVGVVYTDQVADHLKVLGS